MSQEPLVTRFLEAIQEDQRPRAPGLHVTDISRSCLRQSYYNHTRGQCYDKRTGVVFWLARQVHKTPILAHHEFELRGFDLIGTIDDYQDGVLVDKKTVWSEPPKEPSPEHVRQLEYYKVILEANEHPVAHAYILYISITQPASVPVVVEVQLRPSSEIIKELTTRRDVLLSALRLGQPPETAVGSWCNFCPHFNTCFGEGDV